MGTSSSSDGTSFQKFNPIGATVRAAVVPGVYGMVPNRHQPGGAVLHIQSELGDQVDMRYYDANHDRIIVGFHGNGCTVDAMDRTWRRFSQLANVLAVNMPGYGDTSPLSNAATMELHMAANVQAVIEYVTQKLHYEPSAITFYGLSLGGSQAAIGFQMLPGSHLVLHNTFESVQRVIQHILQQSSSGVSSLSKPLAAVLSWSALPRGCQTENVKYKTDRLDTLAKLEACRQTHHQAKSRLLVIAAQADEIMAPDFPYHLATAYYGNNPEECIHIMPNATHNSSIDSDPDAWNKLVAFMEQ